MPPLARLQAAAAKKPTTPATTRPLDLQLDEPPADWQPPDLTPGRGLPVYLDRVSLDPVPGPARPRKGGVIDWRVLATATVMTCALTGGAIAAVLAQRQSPAAPPQTLPSTLPEPRAEPSPRTPSAASATPTGPSSPAPSTTAPGAARGVASGPATAPRATARPSLAAAPSARASAPANTAPPATGPAPLIPEEPTDAALRAAAARARPRVERCGVGVTGGPREAEVTVTFGMMGLPTVVRVAPPLAGTPVADCIVRAVRATARVPPFRAASYEDGEWTFDLR